MNIKTDLINLKKVKQTEEDEFSNE